jgi:regulator of CtrA degradation
MLDRAEQAKRGTHAAPIFFTGVYDEAFRLLVEARDYVASTIGDKAEDTDICLAMSFETTRLTSRLTHVMAWLLVQRAVHSGEMTIADALEDEHRLSGQKVCLTTDGVADITLPATLGSLLNRSHGLYLRVQRLDLSLSGRVPGSAC